MAEHVDGNATNAIALNIEIDECLTCNDQDDSLACPGSLQLIPKLMAEFMGTYMMLFAGFAAIVVNKDLNNVLTFPGVAALWGLDVIVMSYTVGHISGAHFNPAVTIAFATVKRFAWKHVPAYIVVQLLGATIASLTVQLLFGGGKEHFVGTLPAGSNVQSLALEFIITFYLMFAISGAGTDEKSISELSGIAVGFAIIINSLLAGQISGASMNPVRSLGPAIAFNHYEDVWIYVVGPIAGAISGIWFYNIVRLTNNPLIGLVRRSRRVRSK